MRKQKSKPPRACARSSIRDPRTMRRPRAEPAQPDPLESALDAAARLAEPYAEEAESIDNVIRFVHDHRHGRPAEVQLSDVLLALSIILGATDRELTPEERELLAVLELSLRIPTRGGTVRLPGAAVELPLAIAVRRRARRTGCFAPAPTSHASYVRLTA